MKFLRIVLMFALLMALAITLSATPSKDESFVDSDGGDDDNDDHSQVEPTSLREITSRFLAQKPRTVMTCNKYPRVCRVAGSPGPDCCKKKCVNVKTDKLNCGKCGKKCKYSEICCKGQCVNPMSHQKHCGGCNNNCNKGSKCLYGMCSYA
ncbi:stigma-specific STIG1-like protein 1 [Durio zibethinus]|uniref:Stigma-specific STIG1-like protein 1 n=1 Tax=Durio zibethinus TaxID=66656 RepID=A0A6P5WGB5_DURZI|nr:stigma-specific STIG1-like protein 1 [Durio zibethinus]